MTAPVRRPPSAAATKPASARKPARVSADDGAMVATLRQLWPHIWPADRPDLKGRVVLAILALLVAKVVTVLSPYFFKWATDALTAAEQGLPAGAADAGAAPAFLPAWLVAPVMLVIAYNAARILFVGFNQIRDALFARVGQHAVRELAILTFNHLHALSLRFHLSRRMGGLSRVIERGVKGIENIVRFTILNGVPTVFEFAVMAAVIWYQFGFIYVVVVAVMIVAYTWFTIQTSNWRISIRREMNDSDTDANSKVIDSLINFETVKYFGNETLEAERFDRSMAAYERAATRTWTSLAWLNFGQAVILGIGTAICMILSARAIQAGEQTIGDFVMINALLIQLAIPLNFVGFLYREIRQGLADLEAMFDLLGQPAEITNRPDARPLAVDGGAVRFEDVRFHYDPERPILQGISFEVPAGRTVAIVGPSGAGKSTLSRLLFRFYEVTGGRITIDGQDLREVTQASLRAAIGMVPQDTVLFNDTIAYNIRYGRPAASEADVVEAARMAQIADFIEALPDGFATEVGERGLKLSGGEKQRVAIARTILKAPPILVLDEATSALDTQTEREIQSALDQVSRNRTTLVIAHRLSTVVNADEILVLEKGVIVERGRHQELLARQGLYASMWARQQEANEAAERLRAVTRDDAGFVLRGPRAGEEPAADR